MKKAHTLTKSGTPRVDLFPPVVILAAGEGRRLQGKGRSGPKPLTKLLGLSLAERCIATFLEAGPKEFIVVLGYQEDTVRSHFVQIARRRKCTINFVRAPHWQKGNGASALAAQSAVGRRKFLLAMVDHVFTVPMIQDILGRPPNSGEIILGVDYQKDEIFDLDDLTKVSIKKGRVTRIGKDLKSWTAGDTGLFYCSDQVFQGLKKARSKREHSLSDGIRQSIHKGRVEAMDLSLHSWIDVDDDRSFREAKRRLLVSVSKGKDDGYIASWLNRPLSKRLSVLFVKFPVTPNQMSIFSFSLCLAGAACLAAQDIQWWIIGAICIQGGSVLDGCDGEIARLKLRKSEQGAWLDTLMDRYGDMAIAIAVVYARALVSSVPSWIWISGMLSASGFILASYVTKEYQLRFGHPYPNNLVNRIKRRDLRVFAIALGAAVGYPFEALLGVGILSHLCVFIILILGRRKNQIGA